MPSKYRLTTDLFDRETRGLSTTRRSASSPRLGGSLQITDKNQTQTKQKQMKTKQIKKVLTFTSVIGAVAMVSWLTGCATTAGNSAAISASQKEMMLSQAGFVTKTVTTPKQQQQVEKLSVGVVSAVKYKGKLLYVYPTTTKDQIFVGKQAQYDSYKKALQAQAAQQSQTQSATGGVYLTGETAGPNRIAVEEFDGFGPIQDNPAWQ